MKLLEAFRLPHAMSNRIQFFRYKNSFGIGFDVQRVISNCSTSFRWALFVRLGNRCVGIMPRD